MMESLSIIIQIIAGLVMIYVIYVISLYIVKSDKLAVTDGERYFNKSEIPIFNGVLSSSEIVPNSNNNSWNTMIPFLRNYKPITTSMNTLGGAQFSYSFWMKIGNPIDAKNKVIFLKGDDRTYKYSISEIHPSDYAAHNNIIEGFTNSESGSGSSLPPCDPTICDPNATPTTNNGSISTASSSNLRYINERLHRGRIINCPMLKFGSSPMELDIHFNTLHRLNEKIRVRRVKTDDSLKRNNLPGLLSDTWFMFTVTFEDNVPITDYERGIFIRVYINDTLYQMEKIPSVLKQNRGNFHILPNKNPISQLKIADFSYFNYALSDQEVIDRYAKKPNFNVSASSTEAASSFQTVAQNNLDVYNT